MVLSEAFGAPVGEWIILCRNRRSSHEIRCSSYATEAEAKKQCANLNDIFRGERTYRVEQRKKS